MQKLRPLCTMAMRLLQLEKQRPLWVGMAEAVSGLLRESPVGILPAEIVSAVQFRTRVQMLLSRGRKSRPTSASSTLDLPLLCEPTTATCEPAHHAAQPPHLRSWAWLPLRLSEPLSTGKRRNLPNPSGAGHTSSSPYMPIRTCGRLTPSCASLGSWEKMS